jgi:hypothetical protein
VSRNVYCVGCFLGSESTVFCPNETCVLQSDKTVKTMITKRGERIWKVRLTVRNYNAAWSADVISP